MMKSVRRRRTTLIAIGLCLARLSTLLRERESGPELVWTLEVCETMDYNEERVQLRLGP